MRFKKSVFLLFFSLCALIAEEESAKSVENSTRNSINLPANSANSNENAENSAILNSNTTNSNENSAQNSANTENTTQNSANQSENSTNLIQNSANTFQNAKKKNENSAIILANVENSMLNSAISNENSAQNTTSTNENTDDFAENFDDFEAEFESFKVNDPLSGYNKMMTSFNVGLYTYFMRPIAKGYDFIVPDFLQTAMKNLFTYISMPIRFVGNALQFKFKEAGTELKRFGVNTIFGFFGLIDAASNAGIPLYNADFGLVLAHWGVGGGFHFVLPVLGPSNLRDTLTFPVNLYASPTHYIDMDRKTWLSWYGIGLTSLGIINELSLNTKTLDEIYYNTPNLYPFLRDAYEKRRLELSK